MYDHNVTPEETRQRFWDQKILNWEQSKYEKSPFIDFNSSVKFRQKLALRALKKYCSEKTIIEFGCGSAKLMKPLIDAGARKYIGVDISQNAIDEARRKAEYNKLNSQVELIRGSIKDFTSLDSEICFSLGFFDWVTLQEIEELFTKSQGQYHLHSFSEKCPSLQQIVHRLYVYLKYGHKNMVYTPHYYDRKLIEKVFKNVLNSEGNIYSDKKLSFGRFVHNFPCLSSSDYEKQDPILR